jgi:hypothetical protein
MVRRWRLFRDPVVEWLILASLVVFVTAAGVGFWLGRRSSKDPDLGLKVSPQSLNFGSAYAQQDFLWKLPVSNVGDTMCRITGFESSCGCMGVEPKSLELAPGASTEVLLHLDLRRFRDQVDPLSPTSFSSVIVAEIETDTGGMARRSWTVSGQVRHVAVFEPAEIAFGGATAIVGPTMIEQTARLRGISQVQSVEIVETSSSNLEVSLQPASDPAHCWNVTVRPTTDLPVGPFSTDVLVQPRLSTGESVPPVALKVSGYKQAEIEASPPVANFGICRPGTVASQEVIVRSRLRRPFTVEDIVVPSDVSGLAVKLPGDAGVPAREHRLMVTQQVGAPYPRRVILALTAVFENRQTEQLTVPVVLVVGGQL